ncbi:MAG: excinuclease ABC subunit A [Promethearchaeota archaeon]|nr:MAG: excinuclease ABC subunit A [Candidatus Lokiarchaeota archaeon]
MNEIKVYGARLHNLKNVDVSIPKGKIIVITGVSGSGKSSLAFDIIFDEGMNRYLQSIGFPPKFEGEKPFDRIDGLSPTVAIEQRTTQISNPRSTVGTRTNLYTMLRMLYAAEGTLLCPICKEPVNKDLECELCGMVVERLQIKHFSFNEPSGMCLECHGRGYTTHFTEELVIQDYNRNLIEITEAGSGCFADQLRFVEQLPKFYEFDIETPYKDLPEKIKNVFLYGSGKKLSFHWDSKRFTGELESEFEGVIPHMERAMAETTSTYRRKKISKNYMMKQKCNECHGYKINKQAREIKIAEKHIGQLAEMPLEKLANFLEGLNEEHIKSSNSKAILNELREAIQALQNVGLTYLHLNRPMPTLSGGELQRLSLMTHLDAGLDSLIYILDEPSMSLHESEKKSLIETLIKLKNLGNSVIIVEHDKHFIEIADEIIDIGPRAGIHGGEIVYQGTLETIRSIKNSLTGQYLAGNMSIPEKSRNYKNIESNGIKYLILKKVNTHNLKNVSINIPLGMMVGIAGVSGSGKSSLILDTLVPLLKPHFRKGINKKKAKKENNEDENGEWLSDYSGSLEGYGNIDNYVVVNQKPIARVRTSTPCSYTKVWGKIRRLFAKTKEAKERGYNAGHFSYNSTKGRCPVCKGQGVQDLEISFLSGYTIPCKECKGTRYQPEILEVKYKGNTINDVLNMTITEALQLFKSNNGIEKMLKVLDDIGLGYITLGQPSPTLSGGEAQRVKLAKELGKTKRGHSLYILDEPSVGLSFYDSIKLMEILDKLVQEGNTVIIIEHDPEILSYCDYIIELGPKGGPKGGEIIAKGTPLEMINHKESNTAPYLQKF